MYKGEKECAEHILICAKARILWQFVFSFFGIVRVWSKNYPSKLEWILWQEEAEENIEICTSVFVLDYLVGQKSSHWTMWKTQIKSLKPLLCVIFWSRLEEMSIFMEDFVDWLGYK